MLQTAYLHDGPALVRYPRGAGTGAEVGTALDTLPWGRAVVVREGRGVVILAFGTMLKTALDVAGSVDATVVNMRFVKPMDEDCVLRMARSHDLVVTIEENAVAGGAGSGVNELLAANGVVVRMLNLGLPDRFIEQGTQSEQMEMACLAPAQVEDRIRGALEGRIEPQRAARG
jgi:1-deoxy-D-xylulose-5-phosphate synthase